MNIELGIGIGGSTLFAPTSNDQLVAYAWASAVSPSVTTSSVVHKTVNAVPANGDVSALAPAISNAGNVTVLAVIANTNGNALIPSVAIAGSISINAVVASSNIDGLVPAVSTIRNVSMSGIVANSTASAGVPTVSAGGSSSSYYLQLDGVDDKVAFSNNSILQFGVNTFSLEVRLSIKTFPPSADRYVISKRPFTTDGTSGLAQFGLKINSDKTITFSTYNNGDSFVKSSVLVENTEYLISICRRSDGNIVLYVNGTSAANSTQTIRNVTNISDMWFGGNNRDNNAFANIDLKEVRFWNIETTSSMVQSNKDIRLNGNESGLILYYTFQEGTGTVITDKTSTGLNGTLTGGTWVVA